MGMMEHPSRGQERLTVGVAMAIHGLIKANDALTLRFLGRRSTRHEGAPKLFGDLIRRNKIDPRHAELRRLLIRAVAEKSEYDYKGTEVSKAEASRWVRDTERFIAAVKGILGQQH